MSKWRIEASHHIPHSSAQVYSRSTARRARTLVSWEYIVGRNQVLQGPCTTRHRAEFEQPQGSDGTSKYFPHLTPGWKASFHMRIACEARFEVRKSTLVQVVLEQALIRRTASGRQAGFAFQHEGHCPQRMSPATSGRIVCTCCILE